MKFILFSPLFFLGIESVHAMPTWDNPLPGGEVPSPCPIITGADGTRYAGECKSPRDCLTSGTGYNSFISGRECGATQKCCYSSIACTGSYPGNVCLNEGYTPCVGGTYVAGACPDGTLNDLRCCVAGTSSLLQNSEQQAAGFDSRLENNYFETAYDAAPVYPSSNPPDSNLYLAANNPPEQNLYLPPNNPPDANLFLPQQHGGENLNLYLPDNSGSFTAWN